MIITMQTTVAQVDAMMDNPPIKSSATFKKIGNSAEHTKLSIEISRKFLLFLKMKSLIAGTIRAYRMEAGRTIIKRR